MGKPGKHVPMPESAVATNAEGAGLRQVQPAQSAATRAERWSVRRLLDYIGRPPITLVLWDGSEFPPHGAASVADIIIRDRRALQRLVVNPEYEFGEMYSSGRIEVQGNLADCLDVIYRALRLDKNRGSLRERLAKTLAKRSRNNEARARENIRHHYDIGNDFYRLWLDEQLVYTCAYFPTPDATLEQAQTAKLDYVCRKLQLKPGERVVEAGCGWGALALHMARHYGVNVRAYNISKEQVAFARDRAAREGLGERVEFIEDDWRNIDGAFDVFASVGMLEHVGAAYYETLGALIDRVLTDRGRGLIHSIGRDWPGPLNAWIERRIFPGAYPPSLSEIVPLLEQNDFSVLDIENLRLHYAKTLEHWAQRYEDRVTEVEEMFDQTFVRVWRLYLAGSLAAFNSGTLQLFQILFNRSGNNDVQWTRDYLYRESK
jgi:cyclopropane-fatty-acyl-phospholipid synthase